MLSNASIPTPRLLVAGVAISVPLNDPPVIAPVTVKLLPATVPVNVGPAIGAFRSA